MSNPGFDAPAGTEGWVANAGAVWTSDDADGCAGSGSVSLSFLPTQIPVFGRISQCVTASAGTRYELGLDYKLVSAPPGNEICELRFFADTACDPAFDLSGAASVSSSPTADADWLSASTSVVSPAGTQTAEVLCPVLDLLVDQISLSSAADSY